MSVIHKNLAVIQQKLKAPKSQFNKFANYNYRSCEDILEAVKPLLGDLTLVLSDEVISIEGRYYVQSTATLSDGENEVKAVAYAGESLDRKGMDASQVTGSASSYARKYALNGLFAIDDTKDADTRDNSEPEKTSTKSTASEDLATSPQIGKIGVLANKDLGWSNLKVSKATVKLYKKGTLPELTKSEASDFIEKLQKEVDKQKSEIDVDEVAEAIERETREKNNIL